MKFETWLFGAGAFFFVPVSLIYGYFSGWEHVGFLGILLCGGMSVMVGGYLGQLSKRVSQRPEDNLNGEVHEGSGFQGVFAPWSWQPLLLGSAVAIGFLGLAIGWWIFFMGAGLAVIALVGWVFEYSRGEHAH
ncbi:cytochrome c oxidase subunit 4 [Micrococcales bacterium 31B]|nr:cytochrome c oxidase subunit 4 [Micrococcales bacterium 31B]